MVRSSQLARLQICQSGHTDQNIRRDNFDDLIPTDPISSMHIVTYEMVSVQNASAYFV